MIIIALGSNLSAAFGTPKQALRRAVDELAASAIQIIRTSKIYNTRAYSYARQPDFVNAVVSVATPMPPCALLGVLKRIEAQAGRRKAKTGQKPYLDWMPRPL
ncbi:MAG: 2-amino-4-hydroxy-6-hydroxymethyldihydropteridine diphosphokinase, partial [Rhodomicrobium sp.]|nr:2-amino-4-hydroxy-6-hydroxymethyldihydropteridine diphosphokinase [Rhodomicrobium sp.]